MNSNAGFLVLGLGNSLLGDDAVGPALVQAMAALPPQPGGPGAVCWLDGGTIGLALLPAIQDCAGLIAVDAAMLGRVPGEVAVLEGEAMDAQLGGQRHSAHEVALSDLMAAAALCGALPQRRALVAVQPAQLQLGQGLSAPVQQALPQLRQAVLGLLARWQGLPVPSLNPTEPGLAAAAEPNPLDPLNQPKETCHV
jgi:hydrogenase maturation protease